MRKIAHTDTKKLQFYSPKTLNLMLKTTILQQKPLEFALRIKSSTKYHHNTQQITIKRCSSAPIYAQHGNTAAEKCCGGPQLVSPH